MSTDEREKLKLQLMRHEGLKLRVYKDSVGIETIGCGRNLRDKGITADEAMFLLENDLDEIVSQCGQFAWFRRLDGVRQRVIADMVFNLGLTRFSAFKATIRAIESGDYEKAGAQMLKSLWAKQVKGRAERLAQMMRSGRDV
jgi:lysozyme